MDIRVTKLFSSILLGALLLPGCGGGGDDSGGGTPTTPIDPVNQSPTVSITAPAEAIEQVAFTLNATAGDSDGSIASYSWSHDANIELTSSELSAANVTFTTPDIAEDIVVNFTVTATDDDGATATETTSVSIKRKVSNVTITGIVTDEPIANAELEFVVGNESFSAKADANGRYTQELIIDESSSKKLVRVKAKGLDATNPGVEFVSQLTSVEKLLAQAGDDNVLDSTDNFGVNITNVTTAEFALLTRNGAEPTSTEELDAALLNVDADEKIQLATLIKIVVDNPDYQLPEGVNSTLELVANEEVAEAFEEQVNEQNPELIEQTKKQIKEDDDLVTGSKEALVGEFIINSPRYYSNSAFHLSLAADGTGQFNANTSANVTVTEAAGVHTLALSDKVEIYREYQGFDSNNPTETTYLKEISFQVLAENDVFKTIEVTQVTEVVLIDSSNGFVELYPEEESTYTTNLINKPKTIALTADELTTNTWVFEAQDNRFDDTTERDEPEELRFYADGTGDVNNDSSEAFNWVLDGTKLSVSYDEDGEVGVIDFWFTKALSAGYQLVALDTSFAEPSNSLTGLIVKQADVTTTNEDLVGRWHGFVGTAQNYDLNLHSDGTVMIGLGYSSYQGFLEDGVFVRKRFIYNNQLVTSCEGFDSSCYLADDMVHEFINIVDNQFYILRTLSSYDQQGDITDQVRTILIYEYSEDLSYSEFTEELLDNYTQFYTQDGNIDYLYSNYTETGIDYTLEINGEQYTGLVFDDGVLSYEVDGTTWYFELVSADENEIVVCHYQQGSECSAATQISYLPKRPKVTLTVPPAVNGGGQLSPNVQQSFWYQNVGFEIVPDDGYVLDTIEGCDGYVEGNHYIAFANTNDCSITVTFKPEPIIAGQYIINNSDLYDAPAYEFVLNEDGTGSFTYDRQDAITWLESNGNVEFTPVDTIVIDEYVGFPSVDGEQVETHYRTEISSANLAAMPEKGSNWHRLTVNYEYYENDIWVRSATGQSNVYMHTDADYIAVDDTDLIGEWSVRAAFDNTTLTMQLSENGNGSFTNLASNETENFNWQVVDGHLTLEFPDNNGTDIIYFTKDINVGYQFLVSGTDDEGSYTDSGILVRRNQQAITAANFAGRHEFRDGHDLDTHWADIQVYDDGQVFFTFSTSSYQKGFEDGHLKRDLYYDTDTWQAVEWCDISEPNCELYGEFEYTLVAVDGNRYYVERLTHFYQDNQLTDSDAHLYVHDYSPSTKVDQIEDYNMGFTLYQNDNNGIARWSVAYDYYDEAIDKQNYTFQLDGNEPVEIELVDGKLELILDGQDTVIELIDNNRRAITLCKYLKGNSCLEEDKVYLSFDAPEHTITVNSDGNGSLAVGDESIVIHGSNWWTSINPNSGYELDTISGCEGFVNDEGNYEISFVSQSCQIDVTFKELP